MYLVWCVRVCIARPQGSTVDIVTDVSLQYLWLYSNLVGHKLYAPVSCGITSSVEMRPGDVIFTSGGTQLVTDMRPMCRNNVRLQQRDDKIEYFKKSRMRQWLMQCIRCQRSYKMN